jgi:hypothetical protein
MTLVAAASPDLPPLSLAAYLEPYIVTVTADSYFYHRHKDRTAPVSRQEILTPRAILHTAAFLRNQSPR